VSDVVAVVTDLFFQSRINSAGRAAGRQVRFVTNEKELSDVAEFGVALVDLDAGLDVPAAIRRLKSVSGRPVVAFGPHLDTAARKAAKAAGADRVLAKSRFVEDLTRIVTQTGGA
jgi:hypothetical protein